MSFTTTCCYRPTATRKYFLSNFATRDVSLFNFWRISFDPGIIWREKKSRSFLFPLTKPVRFHIFTITVDDYITLKAKKNFVWPTDVWGKSGNCVFFVLILWGNKTFLKVFLEIFRCWLHNHNWKKTFFGKFRVILYKVTTYYKLVKTENLSKITRGDTILIFYLFSAIFKSHWKV